MITALVGFGACNNDSHQIEQTAFYEKMLRLDDQYNLVYDEVPDALKAIKELESGNVLETHFGDTLQLVCRFPSPTDSIGDYLFCFFRDNNGHFWMMYDEEDGRYHIYRVNPSDGRMMFRNKQEQLDAKQWKLRIPPVFSVGFLVIV